MALAAPFGILVLAFVTMGLVGNGVQLMFEVEPRLLWEARRADLWPEDLAVSHDMNPYYLHGDFDGDGKLDVSVWVVGEASGEVGVATIHTSRDSVHVLGAGRGVLGEARVLNEEYWRVVSSGTVLATEQVRKTIPEIGMVAGEEFTFAHDAVEFGFVAKSSWALYWGAERHHRIPIGD